MVLPYLAYDDLGRCHDNRIQTTEFEHHAIAAPQQTLLKPLGHVLCALPISSKAITPPSPAPSNRPPHYISLLRFAGRNRWTPLKLPPRSVFSRPSLLCATLLNVLTF
jgi:hypothetical protein